MSDALDRNAFDAVTGRALDALIALFRDHYNLPDQVAETDAADVLRIDADELRRFRSTPQATPIMVRRDLSIVLERTAPYPELATQYCAGRELRPHVEVAYAAAVAESELLYFGSEDPKRNERIKAHAISLLAASPPPVLSPVRPDILTKLQATARDLFDKRV